jgi:hypothetical protein
MKSRSGFSPLANCPESKLTRNALRASKAATQPKAAIMTMCLQCVSWEYTEAQRCEIKTCALWAFNQKHFKVRPRTDRDEEPTGEELEAMAIEEADDAEA